MQMKELLEQQDFEELMAEARWPARRAVARRPVRPVARRVPAPVRRTNPVPVTPQVKRTPARCPPCAPCTPCPSSKLSQPQLGPLTKQPTASRQPLALKSEVTQPKRLTPPNPQLRAKYPKPSSLLDKGDEWA